MVAIRPWCVDRVFSSLPSRGTKSYKRHRDYKVNAKIQRRNLFKQRWGTSRRRAISFFVHFWDATLVRVVLLVEHGATSGRRQCSGNREKPDLQGVLSDLSKYFNHAIAVLPPGSIKLLHLFHHVAQAVDRCETAPGHHESIMTIFVAN